MEIKERNLKEYVRPEGMEVKINMRQIHTVMAYRLFFGALCLVLLYSIFYCSGFCCGDCYYFWKLRSFGDNDMIVDGEKPYNATIIKGTY